MNTEEAISHLKSLGYSITAPKKLKPIPNGCYRIECFGEKGNQFFFMEGESGEDAQIRQLYESKGYEVVEVTFDQDEFYFSKE
jgi:hypothetical protein